MKLSCAIFISLFFCSVLTRAQVSQVTQYDNTLRLGVELELKSASFEKLLKYIDVDQVLTPGILEAENRSKAVKRFIMYNKESWILEEVARASKSIKELPQFWEKLTLEQKIVQIPLSKFSNKFIIQLLLNHPGLSRSELRTVRWKYDAPAFLKKFKITVDQEVFELISKDEIQKPSEIMGALRELATITGVDIKIFSDKPRNAANQDAGLHFHLSAPGIPGRDPVKDLEMRSKLLQRFFLFEALDLGDPSALSNSLVGYNTNQSERGITRFVNRGAQSSLEVRNQYISADVQIPRVMRWLSMDLSEFQHEMAELEKSILTRNPSILGEIARNRPELFFNDLKDLRTSERWSKTILRAIRNSYSTDLSRYQAFRLKILTWTLDPHYPGAMDEVIKIVLSDYSTLPDVILEQAQDLNLKPNQIQRLISATETRESFIHASSSRTAKSRIYMNLLRLKFISLTDDYAIDLNLLRTVFELGNSNDLERITAKAIAVDQATGSRHVEEIISFVHSRMISREGLNILNNSSARGEFVRFLNNPVVLKSISSYRRQQLAENLLFDTVDSGQIELLVKLVYGNDGVNRRLLITKTLQAYGDAPLNSELKGRLQKLFAEMMENTSYKIDLYYVKTSLPKLEAISNELEATKEVCMAMQLSR